MRTVRPAVIALALGLAGACVFSPDLERFEPCSAAGECAEGFLCIEPDRRCVPECLDCAPPDAGGDAGEGLDAGEEDGGADAGETDAGETDSGEPIDAGTLALLEAIPYGVEGQAYSTVLEVDGGTPPYAFSSDTALPGAMLLTDAGELAGTAPGPGTFTLRPRVQDSSSPPLETSGAILWTVHPVLRLAGPGELVSATSGAAYLETVSATGGLPPYSFRVVSGVFSGSVALAPDGGVFGTPSGSANNDVTVEVSDSALPPQTVTRDLNFEILGGVGLKNLTRSLPDGRVGTPYRYQMQGRGGTKPYHFQGTFGSFPTGLALSDDGEIAGTPSAAGLYQVGVTMKDSNALVQGTTPQVMYTIEIF